MEMEQRDWVISLYLEANRKWEELLNKAKPIWLDDGSRMNREASRTVLRGAGGEVPPVYSPSEI